MSAISSAGRSRLAHRLLGTLVVLAVITGCAGRSDVAVLERQARFEKIVAHPDRSAADRTNDVRRKPAQMLDFIPVRQGIVAVDLVAGGGYTTELLARAVHPGGRVYAQVPRAPSAGLLARLANPTLIGVRVVAQPLESPVPAEVANGGVDLVTLMFNYHDLGHMGVDRERMNRAVFAALRPGGLYVIADHAGRAGTGISESGTLHRVEEAFVRAEVEAAGFRLLESASFLRNPNDPRDKETPDPAQPKDEFVLKFIRP